MSAQIKAWFRSPVYPGDLEKTRRAGLLNGALLSLIMASLILIAGNLASGHTPPSVIATTGADGGFRTALERREAGSEACTRVTAHDQAGGAEPIASMEGVLVRFPRAIDAIDSVEFVLRALAVIGPPHRDSCSRAPWLAGGWGAWQVQAGNH